MVTVRQQFEMAFDLKPQLTFACRYCGGYKDHERGTGACKDQGAPECLWRFCMDTKDHDFAACYNFMRRCDVCKLRGHATAEHGAVTTAFPDLETYVAEWELYAHRHHLGRLRHLYSPYGCYRYIEELDHIDLASAYSFQVNDWNSLIRSMMSCRLLLIGKAAMDENLTNSLTAEYKRRHKKARNALRKLIEDRVLGTQMDRLSQAAILNLYSVSSGVPRTPETLDQVSLYLRLRSENRLRSPYAPLREVRLSPIRPGRSDVFDPSLPQVVKRKNHDGDEINTCRMCRQEVRYVPNRSGYCVCCGQAAQLPDLRKRLQKSQQAQQEAAERMVTPKRAGPIDPRDQPRTESPADLLDEPGQSGRKRRRDRSPSSSSRRPSTS